MTLNPIILNLELLSSQQLEARIDNFSGWISDVDPVTLKHDFEELLLKSGFGILHFIEHHFEPQGYTALWLLSESHFAIHTFPEKNKSYIELSSCNRDMYELFLVHLTNSNKSLIHE